MAKKFFALILILFSLSFSSAARAAETTPDPVHAYSDVITYEEADEIYRNWQSGHYADEYFYQLRDVSGNYDRHTIAGSQWFAIVPENWFRYYYFQ